MRRGILAASAALWGIVGLYVVGVPVMMGLAGLRGAVGALWWLPDVMLWGGLALFACGLVGSEIYIRREGAAR